MEIVDKAGKLLDECGEIMLATVGETGFPRVCVLSKAGHDGIRSVSAATGTSSVKTRHIRENPKASVCFYKEGSGSVTLVGTARVTRERAVLEAMWADWFINHFPGGIDDPEYCVIEFTTDEATLWIDREFVTIGKDQL